MCLKKRMKKELLYAELVNFGMTPHWPDMASALSVDVVVGNIGYPTKSVLLISGESNP